MLLQFSVSNFMSIRKEAVLSMAADASDEQHRACFYDAGKDRILPTAAIYGANAAGKSNLFKAMIAAILIIRNSMIRQVDASLVEIVPFLFDETSRREPTHFDFIFFTNGKKYQYGFSATQEKILEEYLYEYKTSRPSMIFERTETTNYAFTKANERELRAYVAKNTANKLFLSTATAWNCEKTREPYLWFASGIDVYDGNSIQQLGLMQLKNEDTELKTFLLDTLKCADINIDQYHFTEQELPLEKVPDFVRPILEGIFQKNGELHTGKQYEIVTQHSIRGKDGQRKAYALPFQNESSGTQRMFFFAAIIKQVMDTGKTMLMDEIDSGLHPLLVEFILRTFLNREINKHGAQLIFTTHDVNLLDAELFRRDQVYFVEKDAEAGDTILYSLDEFFPQKTENLRDGYLQGRYGAIPMIRQDGMTW